MNKHFGGILQSCTPGICIDSPHLPDPKNVGLSLDFFSIAMTDEREEVVLGKSR